MPVGKHQGFTLIELLVVIAIVGIVSTVIFTTLQSARDQAKDTGRVGDLRQLRSALEENRSLTTGNYPTSATIPSVVGDYTVPTNNSENGGYYYWASNVSDPERFCAWSRQENSSYNYFVVNEQGSGYATSSPTNVSDCDFFVPDTSSGGGNGGGGGGTTDICHFPVGDPTNYANLTVNDGDLAVHITHGDHLGDCHGGSQVTMCHLSVTVSIPPVNVSTYLGLGASLGPCS